MMVTTWMAALRDRLTPGGAAINSDDFQAARRAIISKFIHDKFRSGKVLFELLLHIAFSIFIVMQIEYYVSRSLFYLYLFQVAPAVVHFGLFLYCVMGARPIIDCRRLIAAANLLFAWVLFWHVYTIVMYFEMLPTSLIFMYFLGLVAQVFGAVDERPMSVTLPIIFPLILILPTAVVFIAHGDFYLRIFGVCAALFYFILIFGSADARGLFVDNIVGRIKQERIVGQLERANVELQEARRAVQETLASRTRFFAAVSHDLRQPLHTLGMLSEVMKSRDAEEVRADLLPKVSASLRSVEGLLAEMLDLSRLDAGHITPSPRATPVEDLFREAQSVWSGLAERNGVGLRFAPSAAWVETDPALFSRVLGNFIANALEHGGGRGDVLVGVRRRGGAARIAVYDQGPGVPEAERERIFEAFVGREGRRRSGQRGLGLGLAIARRIATLLGHAIGCDARMGRGAVFWIEAPFAAPGAEAPRLLTQFDGLRVLLLQNDAAAATAMKQLLESWGCAVSVIASVADPSAEAAAFAPDVLLADYELEAGADGLSAIGEMRRVLGRTAPAALVTGAPIEHALGPDGPPVLVKPVKPAQLRALMAALRNRLSDQG